MSVIDEVKQRTDIVEVAGQYTTLAKAGRNFKGLCPFHSEKHASFLVYPEQQSWHCFGACSSGGDVFSFVMKREGISFGDALRLLAERASVTIPSPAEQGADKEKNDRMFKANEAAAQYFHHLLVNSPSGEGARSYIARRGLSAETISIFQLGYSLNSWDALKQYLAERGYSESELVTAGLVVEGEPGNSHDRFRNRLMFPIGDIRGRTTGFGARALDDSQPKYINSPETPIFYKSSCPYGINLAREAIRKQDRAVFVEGYMDVITAHQSGFGNVIASMGTSITEKQVSTLKKLTRNVILALDADAAGKEAALRGIGYENTLGTEVKVAILPQGQDPDEVIKESPQTWQHILDEALPIIDYTFNRTISELDLATAKGKSSAVDKLLPIVTEVKDVVRQAHYLQKLARLVGVSERKLEMVMEKSKPSRGRLTVPRQPEAATSTRQALLANPLEEYFLALVLQHPEFKTCSEELLPDYFENSENREIFNAFQQADSVTSIKDRLDDTIWEHLERLVEKSLPSDQIEQKLSRCMLRLRERFLRGLETKREAVLASEAEAKGSDAELTKLKEQGIEVSAQLREVFIQRARGRQKQRGKG